MSDAGRIAPDLAARIKLVVLDVDGVLTDGGIYVGAGESGEPVELKRFDIGDGLGILLLQRAGVRVVAVSGRESAATALRARELGLTWHQAPGGFKLGAVLGVLDEVGCDWADVAILGDDLPDLPALSRAGLPVAVANAVAEVRAVAAWQTRRPGGAGAVREFAEALLRARGAWRELVTAYVGEREVETVP
jgi:3-deoxy-D-manno-octulosonate 8-phosphate phosphatase (KDO 8-P phosphatase)